MQTTKIILFANAAILVIGTFTEMSGSPVRMAIMSILFVAWAALLVWHVSSSRVSME